MSMTSAATTIPIGQRAKVSPRRRLTILTIGAMVGFALAGPAVAQSTQAATADDLAGGIGSQAAATPQSASAAVASGAYQTPTAQAGRRSARDGAASFRPKAYSPARSAKPAANAPAATSDDLGGSIGSQAAAAPQSVSASVASGAYETPTAKAGRRQARGQSISAPARPSQATTYPKSGDDTPSANATASQQH